MEYKLKGRITFDVEILIDSNSDNQAKHDAIAIFKDYYRLDVEGAYHDQFDVDIDLKVIKSYDIKVIDNIMKTKELKINGTVYAHYHFEGDQIFVKMRKEFPTKSKSSSEDIAIFIISILENRVFLKASYLNIE